MIKFVVSIMAVLMVFLSNLGVMDSHARQPHKQVAAETIYGAVEHVSDGDTIIVRTKLGEKIKVRLYGIDAPEKSQPYGPQATGIMKRLVLNEFATLEVMDTDRYGRKVARVYVNRQDVNVEMLKLGAAWHYHQYDKSPLFDKYEDAERTARRESRGLWNKDNPMPPWEYRKQMRAQGKR